jgi:nitrite reductase/ring-hydroxylating ferredoxin subunit
VVDGPEILCTAHFWRFTTDGTGSKVGMTGRRDPKADIAVYPCREVDGRIEARLPNE